MWAKLDAEIEPAAEDGDVPSILRTIKTGRLSKS